MDSLLASIYAMKKLPEEKRLDYAKSSITPKVNVKDINNLVALLGNADESLVECAAIALNDLSVGKFDANFRKEGLNSQVINQFMITLKKTNLNGSRCHVADSLACFYEKHGVISPKHLKAFKADLVQMASTEKDEIVKDILLEIVFMIQHKINSDNVVEMINKGIFPEGDMTIECINPKGLSNLSKKIQEINAWLETPDGKKMGVEGLVAANRSRN